MARQKSASQPQITEKKCSSRTTRKWQVPLFQRKQYLVLFGQEHCDRSVGGGGGLAWQKKRSSFLKNISRHQKLK